MYLLAGLWFPRPSSLFHLLRRPIARGQGRETGTSCFSSASARLGRSPRELRLNAPPQPIPVRGSRRRSRLRRGRGRRRGRRRRRRRRLGISRSAHGNEREGEAERRGSTLGFGFLWTMGGRSSERVRGSTAGDGGWISFTFPARWGETRADLGAPRIYTARPRALGVWRRGQRAERDAGAWRPRRRTLASRVSADTRQIIWYSFSCLSWFCEENCNQIFFFWERV